jgi:excisionase family DNA binding protein
MKIERTDHAIAGTRGPCLDESFVTVNKAAQFLGLSKSKLYDLMASGELPFYKFDRARRIAPSDLASFMLRCRH